MKLLSAALSWTIERVRDAFMWPVNLVRDLPVRLGRLIQTVWNGLQALAKAAAGAGGFVVGNPAPSSSRRFSGFLVGWLHHLVTQLFDLLGGPEIAQFLMHLITNTTPLNDEELALISSLLGPGKLRYQDVRIAEGGLLDLVFKYNGNLAYTTWHTIHFPRQRQGRRQSHTRANLSILVHELIHVYQYERVGTRYLGEAIYMLVTTKRSCYDYGGVQGLCDATAAGKRYHDFNREQQAQIIQDYYWLLTKQADVTAYAPYIAQARSGEV